MFGFIKKKELKATQFCAVLSLLLAVVLEEKGIITFKDLRAVMVRRDVKKEKELIRVLSNKDEKND